MIFDIYKSGKITEMAKALYREEREIKRLDGWFVAKETEKKYAELYSREPAEIRKAHLLIKVLEEIPLFISNNAIFVGTQRDAFAKTYALINPSFTVEGFSGYCDPLAIYGDIEPNEQFTAERIASVKKYASETPFVKKLSAVYKDAENYTAEVLFFVEQVTGHIIPDFRYALSHGVSALIDELHGKDGEIYEAMAIALSGVFTLIDRYIKIAETKIAFADEQRKKELEFMISSLKNIRGGAATNLYEALQLYMLLWQIMCLEQAPNPYAFSIGNADRIFEPYRRDLSREDAAELFRHFLVFYNVGDRSWAISQNVLVGGKDVRGNDLTSTMTYAILDAYYDMNLPQPILSVKLHKNTPEDLYREMGRFFFTPGVLTPSLFNDDSVFEVLRSAGVCDDDLADYSVAGCQEPLIMGKDNANTTNSWLSLPKVLEVVLTGGYSTLTGNKLIECDKCDLKNLREQFYKVLEDVVGKMTAAANSASVALSEERVPFLSAFMGGVEYGADMRDPKKAGNEI